jgi:N-glycosidase YbiA
VEAITKFSGEYRFLSNFWPCPIFFEGYIYPTVEHAYQAAKTVSDADRTKIRNAKTAGVAKKLGKSVVLRPGWDGMKIGAMYEMLIQKFAFPYLADELLATGDAELIEGNYWGDTFWGQCPIGTGHNHLGKLLMKIRGELVSQTRSR